MPKRKCVESEEGDDSSRLSRVMNSNEASRRGAKHCTGRITSDEATVLPSKRQKRKSAATSEKCAPEKPKITEGFAKPSAKSTSVRQEGSVVRRSPRNKTPVSKHESCQYVLSYVLLPSRQSTSKEVTQNSGRNLRTKQHVYSNRSSLDAMLTLSDVNKKTCDLQTKNDSSNELKKNSKSNSRSVGENRCYKEGMQLRSTRIKNRQSFSPKIQKIYTKNVKTPCSKCLDDVARGTGVSNNAMRMSFSSKLYSEKTKSHVSDVMLNSYKNKEMMSHTFRKSKRQLANENRPRKSYNTRSKNNLPKEKGHSKIASGNRKVRYPSLRVKQRIYHNNTSSPMNCDKARDSRMIFLRIHNEFSGSVAQTVSVNNSKSSLTKHSDALHLSKNELRIHHEQCDQPSSGSETAAREKHVHLSNKSLQLCNVGTPRDGRSCKKFEPKNVVFFACSKNCISPETYVLRSTNAEFSISVNLGVQNLLEMLDVFKSPTGLKKAFSVARWSAKSSSFIEISGNKRSMSPVGTMFHSFAVLGTKSLMSLDAFALNLYLPERKIVEFAVHIISGLRHRLLDEYRSSRTSHDFLVKAKNVLLKPILFAGSSDVMIETSLLRNSSETGQIRSVSGFLERYGSGMQNDNVELVNSRSFHTRSNRQRVQDDSLSVSLHVVRNLVPSGNARNRRKQNRASFCLSADSGNGSRGNRTCISPGRRKILSENRFGKSPPWPITPQDKQIQITLDMCLKNKALSKLPKVKTTQELVNELFDKSRGHVPLSLEKYLTPFPSPPEQGCENGAFHAPCLEVSRHMSELDVNPVASLQHVNHNTLAFGQADTFQGLVNEVCVIPRENLKNHSESSTDAQVCTSKELSDIPDSSSGVEVLEQLPRKDQNGDWHVECVGGNFDCNGNWKQFTECCEKESYNGEKLLILPWITLDL